jgi:RNA polymerase sigma-70 factor (ECF subfamily)
MGGDLRDGRDALRREDRSGTALHYGATSGGFRQRTALPDENGTDALLLKAVLRAKEGDRDALTFLYVRYADNLYGYVGSIVRDEHAAEDITQDLFVKLPSALARYEPRRVPFAAWILRVARNLALDHLRAQRAVPCAEVRPVEPLADDLSFERSRALRDALDALPRDQRQVLILRHVAGMTPGEIARSLGRSEGSIHGLHHRGRRALQRELSELGARPVTSRRSTD